LEFVFINQFYPPDLAPTGRILHDVAVRLARRGHGVRIVCGRRAYAASEDPGRAWSFEGVSVCRVGAEGSVAGSLVSRAAADVAFLLRALRAALSGRRPDLLVAATSPPPLGIAASLAARWAGVAVAHWTMDLYPDVLAAHWDLPRDGWAIWVLGWTARLAFARAALVLTLGPYMAQRAADHLGGTGHLEAVPIWSDLDTGGDAGGALEWRRRRGWTGDDFVLMYSGNMGRGHRFGEFLQAAQRLGPGGPIWAFVGGGPRREEIEEFKRTHPVARVELLPYVPVSDLAASLRSAEVHLVSLSPAWQGLIVPSKLQAAFSVGRPVLFVGPPDNDVAAWIRDSGGGWTVAEDDVDALVAAIEEARDPAERTRRGARALDYARNHFDRDRNGARVADLLESCVTRGPGTGDRRTSTVR
jgi:colanic acid biosynthesis glycosyl transferase WcaI